MRYFRLIFAMLSDAEAEEIERSRGKGISGPVVGKWLDQLLEDRRERIRQLEHLRGRLQQAFRYLDGLVRDARNAGSPKSLKVLRCPKCGKPYERAAGRSPNGVVYHHHDGSSCMS